jgi:hypothetical protein
MSGTPAALERFEVVPITEKGNRMNSTHISLASAVLFALAANMGPAMADEQDAEVRRLNLEQLEKARAGNADAQTAPKPAQPDGMGGPEHAAPPGPDEGMSDEDEKPADEPADTAPAPSDDAEEPDGEPETKAPPK